MTLKKLIALMLCISVLLSCIPGAAFGAAKQMEDGVPVWTEETVRRYALDYISGTEMTRLWNYFDLQIRRYLPQQAFENFLIDLEFLTGDFRSLGEYRCFEESENQLKTHVLHLCMEKQDVDMYFTHKNKENDWEVMAVEFAFAQKADEAEGVNTAYENVYTENEIRVGTSEYPLDGVLTMPASASETNKVPACVFVHDFGAHDRNMTLGSTAMFKDFAYELAEMGIASVRYDKRTCTYPDAVINTVWDEVVEDALSAVEYLCTNKSVDEQRIIVIGLGLGAMLTPRIAEQSEGKVAGMIMIGGELDTLINADFRRAAEYLNTLDEKQLDNEKYIVRNFKSMSEGEALETTILGENGYYYWEANQYDQIRTIRKLSIPLFVAQGKRDTVVDENDGRRAYYESLGNNGYTEYEAFRGLNHLLMDDLSVNEYGEAEYKVATHMDKYAARTLANWILAIGTEE